MPKYTAPELEIRNTDGRVVGAAWRGTLKDNLDSVLAHALATPARINAVAEGSKMTTDALVSEVTISVIGGEDTDVEVMQYQGTIDLDQLHKVLIREFPQLQVREVDY